MPESALPDVSVVELASGVAGPYAGRVLADLGASVVKVEPPEGDALRREGPFVDGESAFFAWLHAGKQSVAAELEDARLDGLLSRADIVVHNEWGERAEALEARIAGLNPRAVTVSLSPYGRWGPRAHWKGAPLTEYATGGFHYFGGDPEREPLSLPGYQVEFHAGMQAAIAALAGLWNARAGNGGQRVEISHQEAMLAAHSWLTTMWTHTGQVQSRVRSIYSQCKDGYIYLFHMVPYPNLFVLMERFDLLEDESLVDPVAWAERFPEIVAAFSEWTADKEKEWVYNAAQELRIAVTPVNTMADLTTSAQLTSRGYFAEVEVAGRTFTAPGPPYKLSATPCLTHKRAPALGEHNDAHLGREATPAGAPQEGASDAGLLAGVRVIEVTANWAGPIAGRHLADLGAEVIKVELDSKPATRALMYAGGDMAWPRLWERAGYFNKLNRNKKDVCLNLAHPDGKRAFLELVRQADVVLENNAARVMPQLGLGFEQLREVKPSLVMCSLSGFGATGPEANYSAYGSNIETASGLSSVMGYEPGDANGTGSFYADPVSGGHGAIAILAALHHARNTGEGQWIDISLLETVVPFFAPQFMHYSTTGSNPEPTANRHPDHYPYDVYRAGGTDAWLALAVRDAEEWRGLCRVLGRDDWAGDHTLATVEGRRKRAAEIDAAITEWSAVLDHNDAAEALQQQGVPAAPVMANWELASDNHLHERGHYVRIAHPVVGTYQWPGFPWRFEHTPARVYCPAPLFAQHNREVLEGVAGLSASEIEEMYAAGATNDEPVYAAGTL